MQKYSIILAFAGRSRAVRNFFVAVLLILGFARTILWQLNAMLGFPFFSSLIIGVSPWWGGQSLQAWLLGNMDAILMYAVWAPIAFLFIGTAIRTTENATRARSIMFALGLLLITYSWVARLQLGYRSVLLISAFSVLGFALLLGGILYRQTQKAALSTTPLTQ